jgi:hypothetical protein
MSEKYKVSDVRKIIREELARAVPAPITADDTTNARVRKLVEKTTKLLESIAAFKKEVSEQAPAAIDAVQPRLDDVEQSLNKILEAPKSYVGGQERVRQVSLRAVQGEVK